MTSARGKYLVIGLGNRFRSDDGVGLAVIAELRERRLPSSVEVLEGFTDTLGLVEHFGRSDRIVIVDALSMREPPGTVRVFSVSDAAGVATTRNLTLHALGLAEVIALSARLGATPRVTIVGVQPESTAPGDRLSETVRLKIAELVEAVLRACSAACEVGA